MGDFPHGKPVIYLIPSKMMGVYPLAVIVFRLVGGSHFFEHTSLAAHFALGL